MDDLDLGRTQGGAFQSSCHRCSLGQEQSLYHGVPSKGTGRGNPERDCCKEAYVPTIGHFAECSHQGHGRTRKETQRDPGSEDPTHGSRGQLNDLKAAEVQAEEALQAFKAKLVEEAKKDDPKAEENTLTDASAKFVSAILPQQLPEEAQQALQIQINQALAAIQAQITKVVTETQEAQKVTELATARAAAPVTPQLPSNGGSPPGTPSILQNDPAKGSGLTRFPGGRKHTAGFDRAIFGSRFRQGFRDGSRRKVCPIPTSRANMGSAVTIGLSQRQNAAPSLLGGLRFPDASGAKIWLEAAAATPFSGCSSLSSCSLCTSCTACIAVSIIPLIIFIIIITIIISVIIVEPGGLTAAIPVPGDHSVPTSEGFSELTGDVPGSRPSLDRTRGRVTGYAPRINRTCGRGRGFFSDELAGLLGGASRLYIAVATRGRVLCGVSLRTCSWTSGPRVRLVWGLMVGFLSCYLTYLVNPLFLGSSCPTFPYDLGVRNLGHSASALVGHLTYDLYSLRAQEIGATMTSASSSSAPNRVPSDVFAGAISGVREPTGQNMAELKMARMTILGSNWGNARRTHHGRVDTIQLLNVAGHLQAVLELGTQATLSQVQEWGWNAVQASEGAPALLWRDGTFTLSEECGREFHTPSGKFAGSAIVLRGGPPQQHQYEATTK